MIKSKQIELLNRQKELTQAKIVGKPMGNNLKRPGFVIDKQRTVKNHNLNKSQNTSKASKLPYFMSKPQEQFTSNDSEEENKKEEMALVDIRKLAKELKRK